MFTLIDSAIRMAASPMNSERTRLDSFSQIQSASNRFLSKEVLARNGFYATGDGMEVQCNWCKTRITDWEQGELKHVVGCAFQQNPNNCGNLPLARTMSSFIHTQESAPSAPQIDYFLEANRLDSFKNWPKPYVTPQSLAKAGFYYLNKSDEVKCAWCGGMVAEWEKEDNAFEEHRRLFPDCPRVQLGPLIEFGNSGIRDLGIQKPAPPKKPKYSSLDARIRTFAKWPISHIQQPEALAQAGLYYQDIDDQVRCFHCYIGLRSWQKEDDPWFEHAKWHPQCQFVQLAKGHSYVKEVQDLVSKNRQQPLPTISIDEAMALPPARQALEIGIDGGTVRAVVQRRLQTLGCPFENIDDLLKAVFEPNDDVEHTNNSDVASCSTSAMPTGQTTSQHNTAQAQSETTVSADLDTEVIDASTSPEQEHSQTKLEDETRPQVTQTSNSNATSKSLTLEEENRKLKDARLCKVCLDEEVGVVFLPCGHLVTCMQCAPGVEQCPMCRAEIRGFVRTFLS